MSDVLSAVLASEPSSPLLAPIPGASPCGVDVSYDPEFERLVGEIEKLTSLAGEAPDWSFVIQECERTLRDTSKDLRAMSWLVAAHAHRSGFSGIAEGLALYAAMMKTWWTSLYPPLKRLRARAGQIEWLWGVLARRVTALPVNDADAPVVRSLAPLVAELGAFFAETLKEIDPGMGPLRIAVREKIRRLPEEPPPAGSPSPVGSPLPAGSAPPAGSSLPAGSPLPAEPASTNGATSGVAILSSASPSLTETTAPTASSSPRSSPPPALPDLGAIAVDPSSLKGHGEAEDAARSLRAPLMTLAHHARRVASASPWSYRLLRVAAWLTIEKAPDVENGKTFIRAPKALERDQLSSLCAAGQWEGLLHSAEEALGEHPFWLDVHRYAALALESKGAGHRLARQAVGRETVALVERVVGLSRLLFSNGTPFASSETIDWLDAERARFGVATGRASTSSVGSEASPALIELVASLSGGDEALATALAGAERLTSARDRFRALLAIGEAAQRAARGDLALAIYERLLPEVDATLERWEPALAADLLQSLLKVLRASPRTDRAPASDLDEAALFRRLLALDPHAALKLRP